MKCLNWRLILGLSLFGLAMAVGTISLIPPNVEPIFWLVIILVCALWIGRRASSRPFLHGLLVGIVNSVWVTGAHILAFHQYIANHPKEAAMMRSMPAPGSPRLMMLLFGPVIGLATGAIIGALSILASRLRKTL